MAGDAIPNIGRAAGASEGSHGVGASSLGVAIVSSTLP